MGIVAAARYLKRRIYFSNAPTYDGTGQADRLPHLERVVVPNDPHYVTQRGHKRQVVCGELADFEYYLETLARPGQLAGNGRFVGEVAAIIG